MTDRDETIQQAQDPAAGTTPAAGAAGQEPGAESHAVAAEDQAAVSQDAAAPAAPPHGDPVAGETAAGGSDHEEAGAVPPADAATGATGATGSEVPSGEEVAEDLEQLRTRAGERDQYLALAQRAQADFDNYRKRMAREAAQAQERGASRLAADLLPALDHLELALKASEAEGGELFKGVRMVQEEILAALRRSGIESFSPTGEPFDPNEHEAMVQRPAEGAEPGTVLEVYQQGYRVNGAVLRPARVVVAA